MSSGPLVAVGIPAYNRPQGLRNSLEAICNQSYANLEIHVSDDCSPDPLVNEVIQEYCQKDIRIKGYKQTKNLGIVGNHHFLLSKISADIPYMMWACDDDDWHPDYIKTCVEKLEKHPEAILCATANMWVRNGALCEINHSEEIQTLGLADPVARYKQVLSNILWWNHTYYGIVRRNIYEKLALKNTFAFDVSFIAQLSLLGQFIKVPHPYFIKTIGGYGSELKQNLKSVRDERRLSRSFPRIRFLLDIRKAVINTPFLNSSQKHELLVSSFKIVANKSTYDQSVIDKTIRIFQKGINALKFAQTWLQVKHFRSAWLIHIHRLPSKDFSFSKKEQLLYSKKLDSAFVTSSDLFKSYYQFLELKEQHNAFFKYDPVSGKNLITVNNILFELKEKFYGFIIYEIFAKEVYQFNLQSPSVVIDIGSNVGVSALYFAQKTNVKRVFGFEPFNETVKAAHDNFKLNPKLQTKIQLENFALSDNEGTLNVEYDFKTSQLSSIKKSKSDAGDSSNKKSVVVQVKEASTVLAPIVEKYKNLTRILKVDTEGSEIEIIQNLHEHKMLRTFNIIMIEWHGPGHKTLLEILKVNNFEVTVADQNYSTLFGHTGMIYAHPKSESYGLRLN